MVQLEPFPAFFVLLARFGASRLKDEPLGEVPLEAVLNVTEIPPLFRRASNSF
ncbi:MAG: hypothetical protein GY850_10805 [bacterium]|nr:hypothetical protein [bacterium]